ncbi:hypothetical protein VNO78_32822 [Psophocarpus tetragonolobus]|uniref:DUF4283 domain-containing protein n=1 Tax=Psophocarpus tetragonolobus TaxID=3891 RepID=A0AAN9RPP8_PSOTE
MRESEDEWHEVRNSRSREPLVKDSEQMVWIKCFGIPPYVWNENFLTSFYVEFMGVDEAKKRKERLDVARITLSTNVQDVLNYLLIVDIDEHVYVIKVIEEGPLDYRIVPKANREGIISDNSSSCGGDERGHIMDMEDKLGAFRRENIVGWD